MNDAVFMDAEGRMDAASAPNFDSQCQKWIDKGIKTIVVDLSKLEYLSSAGLRSILVIAKKLKADGGKLLFCGVKGTVKEIFDISGFSSMFEFYDNPTAALEGL
ncbi:MAG: anti-sigma factor antagonist [Spartobacteria bacterium]|nr:anti-sigma factor antagonist [Spartobacteria bacterium]